MDIAVLEKLLAERDVLLADGATGTNMFALGLPAGHAPEDWNIAEPDKVRALYRGFVEAGSDIILTNSFGGTAFRLKLHNLQDRVVELNQAAATLAREVVAEVTRPVVVAGSVGPTGELLVPLGSMTYDDAVAAFTEQITGLKAGGADVAWIETMSAPEEMQAAAEAAISVGLPYVYTASFDTAGRTMMGLPPANLATVTASLAEAPVAFGANCGVGASDLLLAIRDMPTGDHAVVAKANCGIPQIRGDSVVYTGTPELMADYARLAMDCGVRIIGGCCGTTPEHVRAMRDAIDSHARGPRPEMEQIIDRLGPLMAPPASADRTGERGDRKGRRRRSAA